MVARGNSKGLKKGIKLNELELSLHRCEIQKINESFFGERELNFVFGKLNIEERVLTIVVTVEK